MRWPQKGPWTCTWTGDLAETERSAEFAALLRGANAVVHCAGHAHRTVENDAERQRFFEVNAHGTAAVVAACRSAGVRRFVYVSTIASYAWRRLDGNSASENETLAPFSAYAASKVEGEKVVQDCGLDWVVARLATVFGARDRANFSRLATAMRRRRFPVPGPGSARKSVVPVTLAAEILARLATMETISHRIINVALPEAPSLRQICDAFSEICGFSRAPSVPSFVLRSAASTADLVARVRRRPATATMTLKKLTQSTVVNTDRLREMFPDLVIPSFVDALRPAADYYRSL